MSRLGLPPFLAAVLPLWIGGAAAMSCGGDKADSAAATAPDCSRTPALNWDNFGKGHLDKHCNGCHSVLIPLSQRQEAPVGVDFNTYADAIEWHDRIIARSTLKVLDEPTMPPGGGPSELEMGMALEWLDCEVAKDKAALAGGQ